MHDGSDKKQKVMVIGLDCAPPEHIFDEYTDEIPNLTKLRENGLWGPLESITPPITVPAWMCMMTSKDPGTLGIYGNKADGDNSGVFRFVSCRYGGFKIGANNEINAITSGGLGSGSEANAPRWRLAGFAVLWQRPGGSPAGVLGPPLCGAR